ncbi:MAG: hypothetical protein WC455_15355 [Dehalococcoidia bacterium]|jgi:hypothetical protein
MKSDIELRRENRKLKELLKETNIHIGNALVKLDQVMKEPHASKAEVDQRDKHIALVANALDMARDRIRYFGLGVDYRSDSPTKKRAEIEATK